MGLGYVIGLSRGSALSSPHVLQIITGNFRPYFTYYAVPSASDRIILCAHPSNFALTWLFPSLG